LYSPRRSIRDIC